jgi:2-polyprenyl-3-methyl-5-hydroxy-6-metoxy-1,4-benzoquinol methylase
MNYYNAFTIWTAKYRLPSKTASSFDLYLVVFGERFRYTKQVKVQIDSLSNFKLTFKDGSSKRIHLKFRHLRQKLFPFLFSKESHLAYGVEPSTTKYPLNRARRPLMASLIHQEYVSRQQTLRILDIGCRDGDMLLYCKQNKTPVEFHGLDILEDKLQNAKKKGYQTTHNHDIRKQPFAYENNFFDVVICSHILEHLQAPENILNELNRILKPNGALIVGVPSHVFPFNLWRKYIVPLFNKEQHLDRVLGRFGHIQFFTLPQMKKLLKQSHFSTEKAQCNYLIRMRNSVIENYKGWFRLNQWLGKKFVYLGQDLTVLARLKTPSS